jgi:hypothetical protein
MPVTVQWDNDQKTVLRYEFSDVWTWEEFFEAQGQREPLLQDVHHRVHHLLIFAPHQRVPALLTFNAKRLDDRRFKYSGYYAVVGAPLLMRMLTSALRRIGNTMARDAYFFDTEAEARAFLQKEAGSQTRLV